MAQILALFSLLKKVMGKELSSFSSVGLNNLLVCTLFLMLGSHRASDAFWATLLFQLLLLFPILVASSIDAQHRVPHERTDTWPLSAAQRFLFSAMSFVLNPFFIVLFFGYLAWMDFAVALFFVLLALTVHLIVYAIGRLATASRTPAPFGLPRLPGGLRGIAIETSRELAATLDFWTALLLATSGVLYRLLGHAPDPQAFPVLSVIVAIAMSTIAQRMLCLDQGSALLRYRVLPLSGWKLLVTQDLVFLITLCALTSPLNLRAGCAFGLVALATGRYPSLRQRLPQRRWRFIGGDIRFGIAQVLLGTALAIGAARTGLSFLAAALGLYGASLFYGHLLWQRSVDASFGIAQTAG